MPAHGRQLLDLADPPRPFGGRAFGRADRAQRRAGSPGPGGSHALGTGRRRGPAHADTRPARLASGVHAAGEGLATGSRCASQPAGRHYARAQLSADPAGGAASRQPRFLRASDRTAPERPGLRREREAPRAGAHWSRHVRGRASSPRRTQATRTPASMVLDRTGRRRRGPPQPRGLHTSCQCAAAGRHAATAPSRPRDTHARIHAFTVAPTVGADAPLVQPVGTYILPGQSNSWRLGQNQGGRTPGASWRRLRLKVTTDDGETEIELDTTGE